MESLESIIEVLIGLTVVACLVQLTEPRRKVGFILMVGILSHIGFNFGIEYTPYFTNSDLLPQIYCGSAMLTAMFIIRAITRLKFAPKIAEYVIWFCFASILSNYMGAWMDFKEIESSAYPITFIVLYSWLFYKLTRGEQGNARDYQHDGLISNLRYSHN